MVVPCLQVMPFKNSISRWPIQMHKTWLQLHSVNEQVLLKCYYPQFYQSMNIHLNIFQNIKCELLRYKLCIMASDGTDELEFVLFDKKAEHLIRKAVDKLIDSYNKDNVPHEIQALIGQKFTFIVKISPLKSAGSPNNSYEVLSIANQTPDEKSTTNKMRGPSSATSTTLKSLPPLQCCDSTSYSQQVHYNILICSYI